MPEINTFGTRAMRAELMAELMADDLEVVAELMATRAASPATWRAWIEWPLLQTARLFVA